MQVDASDAINMYLQKKEIERKMIQTKDQTTFEKLAQMYGGFSSNKNSMMSGFSKIWLKQMANNYDS